jgi:hypothetical protein
VRIGSSDEEDVLAARLVAGTERRSDAPARDAHLRAGQFRDRTGFAAGELGNRVDEGGAVQ